MTETIFTCGICKKELKSLTGHYKNVHDEYYIKGKRSSDYVKHPRQRPSAAQAQAQGTSDSVDSFNIPLYALRTNNFEENNRRAIATLAFHTERQKLAMLDPEIVRQSGIRDPTRPRLRVLTWDEETLAKRKLAEKKKQAQKILEE